MSDAVQIALVTAFVNGLITWGVITTKLAWLRRDIDRLESRVNACESRHYMKAQK